MTIYADAAKEKFAGLCAQYSPPVSYWRLGNAFDAIIDYLENVDASAAAAAGAMVVKQYQASLDKLGGYDHAWFDDFGWWTIATQRGLGKPFLSGVKDELTGFMTECWGRFNANAPYVWDRRAPGTFDDCGPAVIGGVWNEYWKGTAATYPGPKGADPSTGTLEGIQNTVTNAVYLIAAQRLGRTDPEAKVAADREYTFLSAWLFSEEPKLWWPLEMEGAARVRERVSHFASGRAAPGFQTDWAWTGDQGLILGALVDRMSFDKANYQHLLGAAKELLNGATMLVDGNGVLRYCTSTGTVPDGDATDYATGPGVFWRNMLYAWKNNPDLAAFLSATGYMAFVKTNADAAMRATETTDFDILTNQLAILVAAATMLK